MIIMYDVTPSIDTIFIVYLQQCKGKYQRAILYVSGDALRVVDEISKVSVGQVSTLHGGAVIPDY
jgi:hypothetical protein